MEYYKAELILTRTELTRDSASGELVANDNPEYMGCVASFTADTLQDVVRKASKTYPLKNWELGEEGELHSCNENSESVYGETVHFIEDWTFLFSKVVETRIEASDFDGVSRE